MDPKEVKLSPMWGYNEVTGKGKIFQLKEGEKLPQGWVDNPGKSKAGKEAAKADEAEGLT